eukprot:Hpha_TRINITY_DN16117_c2_g1::TRINITY_DN16117_c2_g1_i1::g.6853::m.6853
MGAGVSAQGDTRARRFPVCVAADLYGRKSNVRLVFPALPPSSLLIEAATLHYTHEVHALRPPGGPEHPFQVEQIHVYDPAGRQWVELVDTATQLRAGKQTFAFQPKVATQLGVSFDSASVIPEAVGEAVVQGLTTSLHIDYTLEHKLRAVFLTVDRTDKGYVIPGDLSDALSKAGVATDYAALSSYFGMVNTSGNGRVTYPQWARFGREHPDLVDDLFYRPRKMSPHGASSTPPHAPYNPLLSSVDAGGAAALSHTHPPGSLSHTHPPGSPMRSTSGRVPNWTVTAAWETVTQGRPYATFSDLRAAFMRSGLAWDVSTVGSWFAAADRDANGRVSWEEWWTFGQTHPSVILALGRPSAPTSTPLAASVSLPRPLDQFAASASLPRPGDRFADPMQSHGAGSAVDKGLVTRVWQQITAVLDHFSAAELRRLVQASGAEFNYVTAGRLAHISEVDPTSRVQWETWWEFCHSAPSLLSALARAEPWRVHPSSPSTELAATEVWRAVAGPKGFVTFTDMRSAFLRALLPWDLATVGAWFAAADADGNGRISWEEWWRFALKHPSVAGGLMKGVVAPTLPAHVHRAAATAWATLSGGRGHVTARDLRGACLRAGLRWEPATVGRWYVEADSSVAGAITADEWLSFAARDPAFVESLAAPPPPSVTSTSVPPAP